MTSSRYLPNGAFSADLKAQVDAHVALVPARRWRLFLKTALCFAWLISWWVGVVFFFTQPLIIALGAMAIGVGMAAIGFNVQHDGGHRAASDSSGVNHLMAFGLDFVGGSSYVWHWKHNVHHHTNPNLVGLDVDIDVQPFLRQAPEQRWHPAHRYQHLYVWFLYALLGVKWHFVDDFHDVLVGRIGTQQMPRPRGWDLVGFVGGKLFFYSWSLIIPLMLHPIGWVLLVHLLASVTVSLCLASTFQAAHCVEEANFPAHDAPQVEWAVHQVRTCADFAQHNALWSWLLGGLNFQTEHHLFPRLSHVQLVAVAPVVRRVCEAHGLTYAVNPTFGAALASHVRWLRRMGQRD
jgi:linoleoyl-CoA desaturase